MKRILALFLLAVLLPTVLPVIAEEDYKNILTAELWVSGSGDTLLLNKDGTGKLQMNGETYDGKWTWTLHPEIKEDCVSFSYQRSYNNRVYTNDVNFFFNKDRVGNYYLESYGTFYYQNSFLEPYRQSAEEKRYYLHWNENAPLDFIELKLSNAYIYRAKEEPLTKLIWTMNADKNTQYLFAVGTVKNPTKSELVLSHINAEFILDGNRKYIAKVRSTKDNEVYDEFIENGKEQKLFIYSAIPASVLKNAKTAELHINMYDKLSRYFPGKGMEYYGDYFLGLRLSAAKLEAMKKTPAKKKTYYKESTKMPVPTSYIDVQSGSRASEKNQLTNGKKGYSYWYRPKYSYDKAKSLLNSYINALKKDGYKVELMKVKRKGKYDDSVDYNSPYKVMYGKKWIGTVALSDAGSIVVFVFK